MYKHICGSGQAGGVQSVSEEENYLLLKHTYFVSDTVCIFDGKKHH